MRIIYFLLLLFLLAGIFYLKMNKNTEAIFFDVGQGDSFALRTNNNKIILIDGGPDWSALYGLGRWLGFFRREIEIIVLTHTHADHLSALPEIVKRYKVRKIFLSSRLQGAEAEALLSILSTKESLELIYPSQELCIDFNTDCSFCIFPPSEKFKNVKDDNDLSLAVYFNCDDLTVFGAGDASAAREQDLSKANFFKSARILKVSHHGSESSSDSLFLNRLAADIAVISVGLNNSYGHPQKDLINRLSNLGLFVWRTDQQGFIRFFTNNSNIFYKNTWPKWPGG